MFDVAHGAFAKHGDSFFLEETGGVLIISKALWDKGQEEIHQKRHFLFSKRQEALSGLVAQLQAPESFSLAHDLPNEAILLTEKTTVTLSNIEISEKLFFVLLRKTKVDVGEDFSITEDIDSEDCIMEHGMGGNTPICLERPEAVPSLALENIKRMPPNSIGCILKRVDLFSTWLINILPKLRIHEDCEVGDLTLNTDREEHVAGILKHDQMFCVGRVERMNLSEYAVGVITKVNLKDCEIEWLGLHASEEEYITEILKQEKPFCVGRVKNMWLGDYAVGVITKMSLKDCEIEHLKLYATRREHVAAVLAQKKPFCVGRVKRMWLYEYAVGVITKMSLKDCEVEDLSLAASEKAHVAGILKQENPFCVGRVKNMDLEDYAVGVITKMTINEDNTMERFVLAGYGDHFSRILEEGDNSIDLGRIRTGGLHVPERIKRKLRYTLVDGDGKEVLEEEEPSQRGNLLE
ncbi:MAG: uncharacterized protein A8A55_2781 [Amphiamblys sp. WSBS2006]|nr:MAG: uncharacterized protein A8A55_2781 [Amphiamblys sp. WSBS2006]